jgi:hypothetical protein
LNPPGPTRWPYRGLNIEKSGRLDTFFGVGNWGKHVFETFQELDFKGLKGRMLSSSYAPKGGHPQYKPMVADLERLFDRCQKDGCIRIEYVTDVSCGQIA